MIFPAINFLPTRCSVIDTFGGYRHQEHLGAGEFYDMKNMTGELYPLLSTRAGRGRLEGRDPVLWNPEKSHPQALAALDGLCLLSDGVLCYGMKDGLFHKIDLGLSAETPKQLIQFGSYLIVMPDKKYFNTKDPDDFGSIEAEFTANEDSAASIFPYDLKNEKSFLVGSWSNTPPETPSDGDYWVDTSEKGNKLMQYSAVGDSWIQRRSYLKFSAVGVGTNFRAGDSVKINSADFPTDLKEVLENGVQILALEENYIVVEAYPIHAENAGFSVSRKMPEMDFLFEHENRLWGCRYGLGEDGSFVNEIYASKLGDFKNWNSFQGISTDSYVVSCGTDGPWTGAIKALGYPLFFKENYLHKVYGSYPAEYQIQVIPCRGVQEGCHKSLAVVNGVLFYKAVSGVVCYDGTLPERVSEALGETSYSDAVAGGVGDLYYISMKDSSGIWQLFCYHTRRGFWHREDETQVAEFCTVKDQLYYIVPDSPMVRAVRGAPGEETPFSWYVETGRLRADEAEQGYLSRITARLTLAPGTRLRFLVQYDSLGPWHCLASLRGGRTDSFCVPLRLRRCDHLRLRMEGEGEARLHALTLETRAGGTKRRRG